MIFWRMRDGDPVSWTWKVTQNRYVVIDAIQLLSSTHNFLVRFTSPQLERKYLWNTWKCVQLLHSSYGGMEYSAIHDKSYK
jgi:hypothetical protein